MKTAKEYSDTAKREVSVDVDALLAAINEISESEVHRSQNDSEHVSVDGREYHTWRELDWPPESPDNQYHLNK
ncbi:DUF2525 domain-containing protein [Escherichia coli]|uniref:DUF2525 domain-containing protein n=1 Tax=Escherichia coli TaxID=562 RepID=UPI00128F622E|nr:DUF2525 domain-containing protein [Escherichia coli]MCH0659432.1 YodD family protein [Escherichia coli]MDZ9194054.1 DUF2525 domain-containing protein [Escherichia coli]MQH16326.1 DUF2525 domain-containing protein [Escherichia coli]MQH31171.1 DUF2525 domain-containing protein [Escherichia coli]